MNTISTSILTIFILFSSSLISQNTVGLIDYKPWLGSYDGYNLIYPHNQGTVFLLDNCGRIVHEWPDEDIYRPNNTAYLTKEGVLIKNKKIGSVAIPIWTTDGENHIEALDWDNDLLWQYSPLDSTTRLHHDIELTPEGTVLMIAWDHYSVAEARNRGRDSTLMNQATFSPDKIMEYDPKTDSIIWEWKAWDHIIQDVDSSLVNFGSVSEHPERIDINYENNNNRADWMHVNAIDYNPQLDQIMINVPTFNEVWIIDHSTTTAEAAGSTGGKSGRGGDILWRWGNPSAHKMGDQGDQKLFFQHDALWALDYLDEDDKHYGDITVFNNKLSDTNSSIGIIRPVFDSTEWSYAKTADGLYEPIDFLFDWQHPDPNKVYSTGLSSVQVLPNNNLLVCSGRNGYSMELNTRTNNIVWEYITPTLRGERISQGTMLNNSDNPTFRLRRLPLNYPPFLDKDLTPLHYLELDPNEEFCDRILPTSEIETNDLVLYPNPSPDILHIRADNKIESVTIYRSDSQEVILPIDWISNTELVFDISSLAQGLYFLKLNRTAMQSFIKL